VLPAAAPGSDLALDLHIGRDELTLELTSVTTDGEPPGVDSFAWTVLTALADDASADVADGRLSIRLRFVSAAAPLELDDPAAAELS
jgi:serine/threonine-protein kinase RsbW